MPKLSLPLTVPMLCLGVLLAGCSTPSSQTPEPSLVVVTPTPSDTKTVKPPKRKRTVSKPTPKPRPKPQIQPQVAETTSDQPAPPAAIDAPAPEAPVTTESPAIGAPLATLVTAGQLESSSSTQLVFAGNNALAQEDQGLFEDAILLSRVRAGLAAVAEPNLASTAKVSSGTVTLDVPANFEPKTIAAAVDTALNTTGVRKVQVNVASN